MRCQTCKGTTNLHKNSVSSNGVIQYICRDCKRERQRKYISTNSGKDAIRRSRIKTDAKFPDKLKARAKLNYALNKGVVTKPNSCESCRVTSTLQAHHSDYSMPFIVNWLCLGCHADVHSRIRVLIYN